MEEYVNGGGSDVSVDLCNVPIGDEDEVDPNCQGDLDAFCGRKLFGLSVHFKQCTADPDSPCPVSLPPIDEDPEADDGNDGGNGHYKSYCTCHADTRRNLV